jgi:GTP-binding protein Era
MKKCSFTAIIGEPNAGKSTLLNYLIGSKISAVSPKVQTTRNRIKGIKNIDDNQLVYIDTPGIFKMKSDIDNNLNRAILKSAINAIDDVDFIVLMIDSIKGITGNVRMILEILESAKPKKILALNKIDITDKQKLLMLTAELNSQIKFDATFMISSTNGDGVKDVEKYIIQNSPESEWMYGDDYISDIPMRQFAADVTREKLMLNLDQEIPYHLTVETEKYEEGAKLVTIHQVIITASEGHKKIIIGRGGENIKKTGIMARKELERMTEKKVDLRLFVKVREDWMQKKENFQIAGMDF